jgi:hypothetical protein
LLRASRRDQTEGVALGKERPSAGAGYFLPSAARTDRRLGLGLWAQPRSNQFHFVGEAITVRVSDVQLPVIVSLARPGDKTKMWTGLEDFIEARASVVDEVSLFLCGHDEESTRAFLHFWNGVLERDILMEPPTDKSLFIWRLIESVMARVRTIAASAPAEQNRSLH